MPDHLRALLVILALATAAFAFAKLPACAMATTVPDFERRRNLWFAITLTAFLAHNFWIYIVVTALLLIYALAREPNKLAMYFLLLFALPAVPGEVPGLGIVNYIFTIHYTRLLALTVLLSALLSLRKDPDAGAFGRSAADKLITGYIIVNVGLLMLDVSITETLRHLFVGSFLGIFLPYYVASRAPRNLAHFRDALMAFAVAAMVLAAIGAFEFGKVWWLYSSLQYALDAPWIEGGYLLRGGALRASASTGHPLVLGYVMVVAVGLYLYLGRLVPNRNVRVLGLMFLGVGLIVPLSRGPWVGAAAMIVLFIATGPAPIWNLAKVGLLATVVVAVLLLSPFAGKIIDLLPFIGTAEQENVSYRALLLEVSLQVMRDNLIFGNNNYLQSPAMQVLVQGEGIIDTVNTYLVIGLSNGLVGLALFSGFFLVVAANIALGMRKLQDKAGEQYLLGRALLATLFGILVTIFTVSPISVIPTVYFCMAGLGVAYARMLALPEKAGARKADDRGREPAASPA